MYISSNIKYLRKQQGLTQEQLAERLGKTYITIGDYERGKALPPLPVILDLCEIFQVNIDALVRQDLIREGIRKETNVDYFVLYQELKEQYDTLKRLSQLQGERLSDLERHLLKRAPELARELGIKE